MSHWVLFYISLLLSHKILEWIINNIIFFEYCTVWKNNIIMFFAYLLLAHGSAVDNIKVWNVGAEYFTRGRRWIYAHWNSYKQQRSWYFSRSTALSQMIYFDCCGTSYIVADGVQLKLAYHVRSRLYKKKKKKRPRWHWVSSSI